MQYRIVPAVTILLLGCQDPMEPSGDLTSPAPELPAVFAISDGGHDGNPHFYFLPPLVRAPHPRGRFDPTLGPVVKVCPLPACATDVATFTRGRGPGKVTVQGKAYKVTWHTKKAGLVAGGQYRVRVFVGPQQLGFFDFQVVPKRGRPATVPAGFLRLRQGHPLQIRFRIERGAVDPDARIVFAANRNDDIGSQIFIMNADGSNQTNLTNHPAGNFQPAWSPDRSRIAFTTTRGANGTTFEIWLMNADGSGLVQLTSNPGRDEGASWSPDGRKIAFVSDRDGNQEIYVMNADGSGQTRLTNNPARDDQPDWSPDGSKIAFMSERVGGRQDIFVMNADGTNPVRLTTDALTDAHPAWSPDGRKLAFTGAGFGLDIFVINADGSGRTQLTTDPANDLDPTWSPDGSRIAYMTERDAATGHLEIFAMNADGSQPTNLTRDPGSDFDPAWSP